MKIYESKSQAVADGCRSRTEWDKLGRVVSGEPFGIVVRQSGNAHIQKSMKRSNDIVLLDLGEDRCLLATGWWNVYHESQTTEKIPPKSAGKTTESPPRSALPEITNTIISLPYIPLDVSPSSETAPKFNTLKQLRREKKREKIFRAYMPETFSEADKKRLGEDYQKFACFHHEMILCRIVNELPRDAYPDMNHDHMCQLIPNYKGLMPRWLSMGLIERQTVIADPFGLGIEVPRGVKGGRCYGYRLRNTDYRQATWRLVDITDPACIRKLDDYCNVTYPVQRFLRANNATMEIAYDVPDEFLRQVAEADHAETMRGSVADRIESYRKRLSLIRDCVHRFKIDDFSGRAHNNLTWLKRETRRFIRIDGQAPVQIDVKTCLPLMIGLAAQDKGVDAKGYLRICEGDLYQHLADLGGFTRAEVKRDLMQRALFAPPGHRNERLPVWRLFCREFPAIADFCRHTKSSKATAANTKPWNKLAQIAQRREVRYMIFGVCERIRRERPNCWVNTVHDSLYCLPDDAEYCMSVMADEFAKLGVHPYLEPKSP
jgi:hypothetical protein